MGGGLGGQRLDLGLLIRDFCVQGFDLALLFGYRAAQRDQLFLAVGHAGVQGIDLLLPDGGLLGQRFYGFILGGRFLVGGLQAPLAFVYGIHHGGQIRVELVDAGMAAHADNADGDGRDHDNGAKDHDHFFHASVASLRHIFHDHYTTEWAIWEAPAGFLDSFVITVYNVSAKSRRNSACRGERKYACA